MLMSRSGPEFVETEEQLFSDLKTKQSNGEISDEEATAFSELYEFANELGDEVQIGEAKNANFRMYVDAHQGSYQKDPSVFTANVSHLVKIWPAGMPLPDDSEQSPVPWERDDFTALRQEFQSLRGVTHDDQEVMFSTMVENDTLDEFKSMIEEFVATCRQKA